MTYRLRNRVQVGVPAAGQFANGTRPAPINLRLVRPSMHLQGTQRDYPAPSNNGYSRPITEITDSFGDNVLDFPELYGDGDNDPETMEQLRRAVSNPGAKVEIYRAAPPRSSGISPGDWITLSKAIATRDASSDNSEGEDWPVIRQQVPAAQIFSDGSDLTMFGYDGPVLGSTGNGPVTLAELVARNFPSAS